MKITETKLRRIIRKRILEYGPPGIGGQGNEGLGSEMQIPPKRESSRGSWPEFIELVQDGDEERALMWLEELFDGSGVELTREWEDEFIMLGREGIWTECERAWKVIQSGDY